MSHEMIETLLRSESVIVPYEEIRGENQVSSILCLRQGSYMAFDLVDDDKNMGPIDLKTSRLSSEQIESWLNSEEAPHELVIQKAIHLIRSSFLFDNEYVCLIEGIDLMSTDGRILQLRREGAAYPHGLLLKAVLRNTDGPDM